MGSDDLKPDDVVDFWLSLPPSAHFKRDEELDAEISRRFSAGLEAAKAGKCDHWCSTPRGALALVILLDQFSRNIHRDTPAMFEADEKALSVAREALLAGADEALPRDQITWFVMPFMHAEDLKTQAECVALCVKYDLDNNLSYAIEHAEIIRRFGRFPHRNSILGRTSSEAEVRFLDDGGFAG